MKKNTMLSFALMLTGAILLAACGQAAAPSAILNAPALAQVATTAPPSAVPTSASPAAGNCSLLSKNEIGTVLGEAVVDVRTEAKGTLCAYQTKTFILELSFLNTGGMTGVQYMQSVESINGNPALIAGLGDEAFKNVSPTYQILYVRKGNSVYTFGIRNSDPAGPALSTPDVQAKEKSLAELLLSRLP